MPLNKRGILRIQKELENFNKSPDKKIYDIIIHPENMQLVYGIVFEIDTPYQNGEYIMEIKLHEDYPLAPPVVKLLTPNGRFQPNVPICLSITHYHQETWSPLMNIEKIIESVVSVFFDKDINKGIGMIDDTDEKKSEFARLSKEYNRTNYFDILSYQQKK